MLASEKLEILEVVVANNTVLLKYKMKNMPISGTGMLPKDTIVTQTYQVLDNQLIKTKEQIETN